MHYKSHITLNRFKCQLYTAVPA